MINRVIHTIVWCLDFITTPISAIEWCLVFITVLLALALPRLGSTWFSAVEQRFSSLARRRKLSVAVTGLLALLARLAVLPLLRFPNRMGGTISFRFTGRPLASGSSIPQPPAGSS
jgi:hypothetical protein